MLTANNLADALTCIAEHPGGMLATTYHVDGRCSWAYRWAGGWDAWRFQADGPHPAIAHKFLPGYFGLPECYDKYEARQAQAWCSEVYQTNAFEL